MNKLFGKRLKEIRENKNLTRAQIAKAVKTRPATISDFENGKTSIKIRLFLKFAKFWKFQ